MDLSEINNLNKGKRFEELEGLIVWFPAARKIDNLDYLKKDNPFISAWEIEDMLNHNHPGLAEPLKECINQELFSVNEIKTGLKLEFPKRYFTISHKVGGCRVSFWQTSQESPRESGEKSVDDSRNHKQWCNNCRKNQDYEPIEFKDPRIPEVNWGKCIECGYLLIAGNYELLTFIGTEI